MKEALREALLERALEGRISCMDARQVAEETGNEYSEIGRVCNELGLKVHACELGCF